MEGEDLISIVLQRSNVLPRHIPGILFNTDNGKRNALHRYINTSVCLHASCGLTTEIGPLSLLLFDEVDRSHAL